MTMDMLANFPRSIDALGPWHLLAVDIVLKTTILFLVAAVASAILRRRSAAARHLIWASALGGSLAVPILSLALPSWRLAVLPATVAEEGRTASIDANIDVNRSVPLPPVIPSAIPTRGPSSIPAEEAPRLDPPVPIAAPIPLVAPSPLKASSTPDARSWQPWIVAAWGIGVLAVTAPMLVATVGLRRLGRRSARLVEGPEPELAGRIREQLRLARPVAILRGDDRATPMTWGVLRPVVLLPGGSEEWPLDRLRAVLLHELAHVARWDCLTLWMSRISCAVYWFHPLAWLASARLKVERERACDDLVLRSGARPSDYAGHLLAVAKTLRPSPGRSVAAVAMARPSGLEGRLLAILDASRSRRGVTRRGACLLLATVAALLVPLSAARLGARPVGDDRGTEGGTQQGSDTEREDSMLVSGRVLDPEGGAVPGAQVAILGYLNRVNRGGDLSSERNEVLGLATTDRDGRFRLRSPRTSSASYHEVTAIAAAAGYGLVYRNLNPDADQPEVDLQLLPEQVLRGRIVDLQGQPGSGVNVHVAWIGKPVDGEVRGIQFWNPPGDLPAWPAPATTDDEGRFTFRGLNRDQGISLQVRDEPFARQWLLLEPPREGEEDEILLTPAPSKVIEGVVTRADTGQPMPHARLTVYARESEFGSATGIDGVADEQGRFRINPNPGSYFNVTVYPPDGEPYLNLIETVAWPAGVVRHRVDLAVPRGVLVRGRIAEEGTGRPVAGASVQYFPRHSDNPNRRDDVVNGWQGVVVSGHDGTFAIAVLPGPGHLLIHGGASEYILTEIGQRQLYRGQPGGQRYYAHAVMPLDIASDAEDLDVAVPLRRGVSIEGVLVGPDGKPVDDALMISNLRISHHSPFWRGFPEQVRDGRFRVDGLDPDRSYMVSFLDPENRWGATAEFSGAQAGDGPVTVRLLPCGSATARFVDEEGAPVVGHRPMPWIVVTPGPGTMDIQAISQGLLTADEDFVANVDRRNYWDGPYSDDRGHCTLPALIPGATYRLAERDGEGERIRSEFVARSGETLDLGEIVITQPR